MCSVAVVHPDSLDSQEPVVVAVGFLRKTPGDLHGEEPLDDECLVLLQKVLVPSGFADIELQCPEGPSRCQNLKV